MNHTSTTAKVLSCIITASLGLQIAGCLCNGEKDDPGPSKTPETEDPCDVQLTECAADLIGFANGVLGAINAIQAPLETRTTADMLPCPADTGAGESPIIHPSHVNIFSYVGPLPKGCNRKIEDDCADPARSNYWVSVVDDRRAYIYAGDPYSFRVIWGEEILNYTYYGSCSPDPNGFDNPAAGIPKLLVPVNDLNGDGILGVPNTPPNGEGTCVQNHVFDLRFYVPDGNGGKTYVEKGNIAQISSPSLAPSSTSLPGIAAADREDPQKSAYVTVDVTLKDPAGQVITAFAESNYEGSPYVQWKETVSCGEP
jgi:hypothetical protein